MIREQSEEPGRSYSGVLAVTRGWPRDWPLRLARLLEQVEASALAHQPQRISCEALPLVIDLIELEFVKAIVLISNRCQVNIEVRIVDVHEHVLRDVRRHVHADSSLTVDNNGGVDVVIVVRDLERALERSGDELEGLSTDRLHFRIVKA